MISYSYNYVLHMQEPVTVDLGTSYVYQKHGAKRRLIEKRHISVRSTFGKSSSFSTEQGGV